MRYRSIYLLLVVSLALVTGCGTPYYVAHPDSAIVTSVDGPAQHRKPTYRIRMMVIGGSVAHGWKAQNNDGYLQRAVKGFAQFTSGRIAYYDRTIVGADGTLMATQYKGAYEKWMKSIKPNVVLISWGLLDDAYAHIAVSQFERFLAIEVDEALRAHAVVLIVTPPVTEASYTQYRVVQPQYIRSEFALVRHLHSPDVRLLDVFDAMKRYLLVHHQTVQMYAGDGWHPNTLGHILAGRILLTEMQKTLGRRRWYQFTTPTVTKSR